MITFTREQLYNLVWAKPMRNIAADYGVNAIELAKKCDEHDIPRPKAGYWQKLEHGKPTERASLGKDISPNAISTVVQNEEWSRSRMLAAYHSSCQRIAGALARHILSWRSTGCYGRLTTATPQDEQRNCQEDRVGRQYEEFATGNVQDHCRDLKKGETGRSPDGEERADAGY